MQNSGPFRSMETYGDEDKFFSDNFPTNLDNDYVLSYLNDNDVPQSKFSQNSSLFNHGLTDLHTFPGFQDHAKTSEPLQGRYGKQDARVTNILIQNITNPKDSWPLGNSGEYNGGQYNQSVGSYKEESSEDYDGHMKVKKIKVNKDTEIKRMNPSKIKSNIKNTYINKINSLITEERTPENKGFDGQKTSSKRDSPKKSEVSSHHHNFGLSRTGMKKVKSSDVLKEDELDKLNLKLAKNRESARNSRIRKKVYIDLLEKTVDQLQQELLAARKQLEANNSTVNLANFDTKPINNLHTAKHQLLERLEKMLSSKLDESEISFLLDSLRLRFGASGKERIEVVNFLFRQMLEFLVPVHMKYMIWVASQGVGKDLFSLIDSVATQGSTPMSPAEYTEYFAELASQVKLSESQKKQVAKYKKKLLGEKQKFEGMIQNLNQVRKSVLNQVNNMQGVVDEFRNYLTPAQLARIILNVEKEKNKKEFAAEKLWVSVQTKKESQDLDAEASDNFLKEGDLDSDDDGEKDQMDNDQSTN